jgi:chromosome partitioning protein
MPTIAFISPKGGVGKTTAATILATQLARTAKVIVIDADPNRPIAAWEKLSGELRNIIVESDVSQDNIIDKIDDAAQKAAFVIVDCEGTASLTIVPTQGSQLDAKEAARALTLVKHQEKQSRRAIPHSVLLTRTSPIIRPRTLTAIQTQLHQHGVRMFNTQLNEREAFRAIFSFGGALEDLPKDQVGNLPNAIANARAYTSEIVEMLRTEQEKANLQGEVA